MIKSTLTDTKANASKLSLWLLVAAVLSTTLFFLMNAGSAAAQSPRYINGLVFIDENRNGVWDAGESGYKGEFSKQKENGVWISAYRGTDVTFSLTNAKEVYTMQSAGYRAPNKDGQGACTAQDLQSSIKEGEHDGSKVDPIRPCAGTFGYIIFNDGKSTWDVNLTIPEGYEATTDTAVVYKVGEDKQPIDFGIAPIISDVVDAVDAE